MTPQTAARQASLSITNSWSLLKLMSIELVMPSNDLILCRSLLLRPSIFPSIRVFSNESTLHIRWPKYWSFSFAISPSNEESGLISFRMGWFDEDISERILKRELDQGWCPCQIHSSPQDRVSQRTGPSQLFPPQIFYFNREPLKCFDLWKGTCLCDAHEEPPRLLTSQNASVQRCTWEEPAPASQTPPLLSQDRRWVTHNDTEPGPPELTPRGDWEA